MQPLFVCLEVKFALKKGQATYIAPLQPPYLAAFPPWGDSEGAGRTRLTRLQKYNKNLESCIYYAKKTKDFSHSSLQLAERQQNKR